MPFISKIQRQFDYNRFSSTTPIVIDNGASYFRIGWAGESEPRVVFRNIVQRPRHKATGETVTIVGDHDPALLKYFDCTRSGPRSAFESDVVFQFEIMEYESTGDVLVFLTGQDDIDAAVHLFNEEIQNNRKHSSGLVVLPLYSGLPRADQELVFSPAPRGKRKVVISTNIAETSLTLEGIVYVVDSGFSKQRFYNPISDIENLVVAPISRASARQRAGRAGRVRPGKCYRSPKDQ